MAITKKEITKEYIRDFCKQSQERKDWYNKVMTTEIEYTDKETGEKAMRKPTFIDLQLAFIKEFVPELAPKPKRVKKESIYDLL